MLTQLLTLIQQGAARSKADLARQMNVSPALLEEMIQQLVKLGYLQDLACASDHCDACAAKGGCFTGAGQHFWILTAKGRSGVNQPGMEKQ